MENASAVEVRLSAIGLGVFATHSFDTEEVIGLVAGNVIDDPEYGSNYAMDLGGSATLEPFAPFRFLNHSCSPNCMLVILEDDGGSLPPEMTVEALQPIRPGEELLIDYGYAAGGALECRCGSPTCRGWIVAEGELAALHASLADAARAAHDHADGIDRRGPK